MGYKYAVPIPLKLTRAESDVNKVTTYRKEYGRRTNAHYATSTPTLRTLKAPLGLPADLWGAGAGRFGPGATGAAPPAMGSTFVGGSPASPPKKTLVVCGPSGVGKSTL